MVYREFTRDDTELIIQFVNKYLTDGEYVDTNIRKDVEAGNYYGIIAEESGKVAGILTFKQGIDFTCPHPELDEEVRALAEDKEVFNGDAIAVLPDFRKRGLGRELIIRAREKMKELGGKYFLGELWIHPDGVIPVAGPSKDFGKTVWQKDVPLFYKDFSKYGMRCPICGENCICGAQIRLIRLEGI